MSKYVLAVALAAGMLAFSNGAFAQDAPATPAAQTPAPGTPAPASGGTQDAKAAAARKKVAAKAAKKAAKAKPKKAKGAKKVRSGDSLEALKEAAPDYHRDKEKKTAGGNASIDNNDEVAKKLRGKPLDEVYAAAAKALAPDETVNSLKARYKHLNEGMQRMNLGNRLRGALNAK